MGLTPPSIPSLPSVSPPIIPLSTRLQPMLCGVSGRENRDMKEHKMEVCKTISFVLVGEEETIHVVIATHFISVFICNGSAKLNADIETWEEKWRIFVC